LASAEPSLAIYLAHRNELLNYAHRLLRDRASAEDLVQEAWLRFSSKAGESGDLAQPTRYLFTIVRNLAVDWLRRRSIHLPQPIAIEAMANMPSDAPSAERILHFRDELRSLEKNLAGLPERTQVAFVLYRVEGRTLQEIARHLGVSVPRVHKMIKDALLHCTLNRPGAEGLIFE
jgi:RNA polymerase sigma-70 factor (ECF subfamily)